MSYYYSMERIKEIQLKEIKGGIAAAMMWAIMMGVVTIISTLTNTISTIATESVGEGNRGQATQKTGGFMRIAPYVSRSAYSMAI
jgi:hypothetical protein